jgi:hypothetical protein
MDNPETSCIRQRTKKNKSKGRNYLQYSCYLKKTLSELIITLLRYKVSKTTDTYMLYVHVPTMVDCYTHTEKHLYDRIIA